MKRIYLIRHGRQDTTLCNVNAPLDDVGREQADLLGKRLASKHFDLFFSSSLIRSKETASLINNYLGMTIEEDSSLNEIDWGDLTGLTNQEKDERFPQFMKDRLLRKSDLPFPGGESGEMAFSRTIPFFKKIEESNASDVLIVTHGGLIRSVIVGLLCLPFKDKLAFGYSLENTSITEIVYYKENYNYTLERLNDYSHLECNPELLRSSWNREI